MKKNELPFLVGITFAFVTSVVAVIVWAKDIKKERDANQRKGRSL